MTIFTREFQTQNVLQISFKLRLPLATTLAFGLFLTLCSKTEESETLKELASASNCPNHWDLSTVPPPLGLPLDWQVCLSNGSQVGRCMGIHP